MGLTYSSFFLNKSEFLSMCDSNVCASRSFIAMCSCAFSWQRFLSWWQPDNVIVVCLSIMEVLNREEVEEERF